MSKAFTRESDDAPERPTPVRLPSLLPPGAKNYLTPDGARRLRQELNELVGAARPRITSSPDAGGERHQLQAMDQRIQHLRACLESAEIVPPPAPPRDRVRFGTAVTVRDASGEESSYRIVGLDEADVDQNRVSWLSPIAKALLNARLGQRVRFKFPSGEEQLEIVNISYE